MPRFGRARLGLRRRSALPCDSRRSSRSPVLGVAKRPNSQGDAFLVAPARPATLATCHLPEDVALSSAMSGCARNGSLAFYFAGGENVSRLRGSVPQP